MVTLGSVANDKCLASAVLGTQLDLAEAIKVVLQALCAEGIPYFWQL